MTPEAKKALKVRAHALKPVIWLGQQGLTPAVLAEIDLALTAHELIKVKVPGVEKEMRQVIVAQIVTETLAELVQLMGQIATIYRKNKDVSKHKATPTTKKR